VGKPVAGEVVVIPFPQTDLRAGNRADLRQRGPPMIIWKDGKVREIPA